jgi:homoserine acetyltransferase
MELNLTELVIQSRSPVVLPDDFYIGDGVAASTASVLKEINVAYEKYKDAHQWRESVLLIHSESSSAAKTALENIETAYGVFKNVFEKNEGDLPKDKAAFYNDLIKTAPFLVPESKE